MKATLAAVAIAFMMISSLPFLFAGENNDEYDTTLGESPQDGPNGAYSWYINGNNDDGSGTNWSWVKETKTLTLNNFVHSSSSAPAITTTDGVTINLVGANSITSTFDYAVTGGSVTCCTMSTSNLTITGTGSLTISGGSTTTEGSGICAMGKLTINGNATVNVTGATITGASGRSHGIDAASMEVGGNATVNATGGSAYWSDGINCLGNMDIKDSATVNAIGGNGGTVSYGISFLTFAMVINIYNNANMTAAGGTATDASYGVLRYMNHIMIYSGTFTVKGHTSAFNDDYYVPDDPSPVAYTVSENYNGSSPTSSGTGNGTFFVAGSTHSPAHKYAKLSVTPSPTNVTFTAVQVGGTSGTANSTGIQLTFDSAVTGLTASSIFITDGVGAAVKGTLSGSDAIYVIALSSVTAQGSVNVSVANFGLFKVTTTAQTVAVYKNAVAATDVTFTAVQVGGANGTADSTGIQLTFSEVVTDLAASNITIANGTGAAVKGTLSGSGKIWTIALSSVTTGGNVNVSVANFGTFNVTTGAQSVTVYKDTRTPVTFTVTQVGGTSGTADSTGITLTFAPTVTGLTASNITITNGTGAAVKGTLSGSGTVWTIALSSVTTEGNVSVTVSDFGAFKVTTTAQSVAVYKDATVSPAGPGGDNAEPSGSNTMIIVAAAVVAIGIVGAAAWFFFLRPRP